mmetsp:Transcript_96604/g.191496  ORF Transcript_96604/g.191496 Transcript_96604/m.191496 type:complete len:107 (+) Transcript_96604:903-1223(+)
MVVCGFVALHTPRGRSFHSASVSSKTVLLLLACTGGLDSIEVVKGNTVNLRELHRLAVAVGRAVVLDSTGSDAAQVQHYRRPARYISGPRKLVRLQRQLRIGQMDR